MIILGLDPGTTRVGYGVIEAQKGKLNLIKCGLIGEVSADQAERLRIVEKELGKIIKTHKPVLIGIEKIYFSKNRKTAMSVAEARGVMIALAGRHNIPVLEFGPSEVKKIVTGSGAATKEMVGRIVALTLNLKTPPRPDDVSDALAIAIMATFHPLTRKTP
ncbi:MAG: crossover junction endodeoxyribonuclease RuvC [Candidatus Colwellbacteria bacterium]|nr:crossover junction endodeoxyribonuclease RuvC [Candidatus Colwellbacteria bacterium]